MQPPRGRRTEEELVVSPKGNAFGRAIRKLTPRKSSMVNLLKGKGWKKDGSSSDEEHEVLVGPHVL